MILASALGSAPESRRIFAGAARSLANIFDNDDLSYDNNNNKNKVISLVLGKQI